MLSASGGGNSLLFFIVKKTDSKRSPLSIKMLRANAVIFFISDERLFLLRSRVVKGLCALGFNFKAEGVMFLFVLANNKMVPLSLKTMVTISE